MTIYKYTSQQFSWGYVAHRLVGATYLLSGAISGSRPPHLPTPEGLPFLEPCCNFSAAAAAADDDDTLPNMLHGIRVSTTAFSKRKVGVLAHIPKEKGNAVQRTRIAILSTNRLSIVFTIHLSHMSNSTLPCSIRRLLSTS